MNNDIILLLEKVFKVTRLKSQQQKIPVVGKLKDGNSFIGHGEQSWQHNIQGRLATGEPQTSVINMKANLTFVTSTLCYWDCLKYFCVYFNTFDLIQN